MRPFVTFIGALALGIVAGAAGILYLIDRNKRALGSDEIMFPTKFYYSTDTAVMVSGTLAGEGLGYPNNTYSIGCYQESKQCWVTSVQQIGENQIGRMDAPYAYDIRRWTNSEVVAGDEGTFVCNKITITIDRLSKQTLWVEEPVNQTKPLCKDADPKIRKYSIEDSPGWKKLQKAAGSKS